MTDSPRPQITESGWRGQLGRYRLDSPPGSEHVLCDPGLVGKVFGHVKIVSPEKRCTRYNKRHGWGHPYVLVECTSCGKRKWISWENLKSGKTQGCRECSVPSPQYPRWLDRRFTAAKQRCTNPKDPNYDNYGGRGIKFGFGSVSEACLWTLKNFGPLDREMEIDRINTNGDYAPGNIRLVDHLVNSRNKRTTVLSEYDPKYWPYARSVVVRKLSEGLTREEIIKDAETAVFERRKNWRGIRARLASMTYEMPASITVLPYRGGSSTTADTVAV